MHQTRLKKKKKRVETLIDAKIKHTDKHEIRKGADTCKLKISLGINYKPMANTTETMYENIGKRTKGLKRSHYLRIKSNTIPEHNHIRKNTKLNKKKKKQYIYIYVHILPMLRCFVEP